MAAAGLAAVAATVLAMLVTQPTKVQVVAPAPGPAAPQVLVLLRSGTSPSLGAVLYDPATRRLTTRVHDLRAGRRVPELWVIPAGGAPRALGLIDPRTTGSLVAAPGGNPFIASGATLAISLEPEGGSPTGLPTGPVVLTGDIS